MLTKNIWNNYFQIIAKNNILIIKSLRTKNTIPLIEIEKIVLERMFSSNRNRYFRFSVKTKDRTYSYFVHGIWYSRKTLKKTLKGTETCEEKERIYKLKSFIEERTQNKIDVIFNEDWL